MYTHPGYTPRGYNPNTGSGFAEAGRAQGAFRQPAAPMRPASAHGQIQPVPVPAPQGFGQAMPQAMPDRTYEVPVPQGGLMQAPAWQMPQGQIQPQSPAPAVQPPMQAQAQYQAQQQTVPAQPQYQPQYAAVPAAPAPQAPWAGAPQQGNWQGGQPGQAIRREHNGYLLRKFKEFDQRNPGDFFNVRAALRNFCVAKRSRVAYCEYDGVWFLKFPYDPSKGFSSYIRDKYKAEFYKGAQVQDNAGRLVNACRLWCAEKSVMRALWSDMLAAARGGLRLPDGTLYQFPKKQPYSGRRY